MEKLEELKHRFEGVKRGLEFMNEFSAEINNLEQKSRGLDDLEVFDIKSNSFKKLKVNKLEFENQLGECYKNFLRKKFFNQYEWYNKFISCINNILFFKYDILETDVRLREYFNQAMTICLIIFSHSRNNYSYDSACFFLKGYFKLTGFDEDKATEYQEVLLNGLIEEKLILVEKNFFGKIQKFKLSDEYFDVVLGVTSVFLVKVFPQDESCISFNSKYGIETLELIIENFFKLFDSKADFQLMKQLFYLKFPEETSKLNNFSDIIINLDSMYDQKEGVFGMYYLKMLLNEFCFQKVIACCFKRYYTTKYLGTKNILFSPQNLEYHLYVPNDNS